MPDVGSPGQIAAHRLAAGDVAQAIARFREAAESALGLGAVAEAAAYWRQAADLAEADDPGAAAADRARASNAMESLVGARESMTPVGLAPTVESV
jgi:hypothetical protein